MLFDAATLFVVGGVTTIIQGVLLSYFWVRDRRFTPLLWWAAAYLVAGVSRALPAWLDLPPDGAATMLADIARLSSFALAWQGARVFDGRTSLWPIAILLPIIWLVVNLPAIVGGFAWARSLLLAAGIAALSVAIAVECWRGRGERLMSRDAMMALAGILAFVSAARAASYAFVSWPIEAPALWNSIAFLFTFLTTTTFSFLAVALSKERATLASTRDAVIDPVTGVLARGSFVIQAERAIQRNGAEQREASLLFAEIRPNVSTSVIEAAPLNRFARVIGQQLRSTDVVGRTGHADFACLLTGSAAARGTAAGERMFRALKGFCDERGWRLDMGIASTSEVGHDLTALAAAACVALDQSRAQAGSGVVLFDPAMHQPAPFDGEGGDRRVVPFLRRQPGH